jgi:cyclophilin family peptidyl-prolyl cis-trans isomerase
MFIDQTTKQPRFIPLEIAPSLKHNAPGVVAMAHGPSPNSASSQFYITLSPQPALDGKYAIFGGVISGMEAVRAIVKGDKMTTVSIQMP